MTSDQQIDDLSLLRAWQAGDRLAGAALCERYHFAVQTFVRSRGAGPDTCADITNQTFLTVCETLYSDTLTGNNPRDFLSYLLKIARWLLTERLQAQRYDPLAIGIAESASLDIRDNATPTPQSLFELENDCRRLRAAIRHMPPWLSDVLILNYWYGYSLDEIAVLLSIPRGTLGARLRDARAWLKRALATDWNNSADRGSERPPFRFSTYDLDDDHDQRPIDYHDRWSDYLFDLATIPKESEPSLFALELVGDISEMTSASRQRLERELQYHSGDPFLEILDIRSGSIIVIFTTTTTTGQNLICLISDKRFDLDGFAVKAVYQDPGACTDPKKASKLLFIAANPECTQRLALDLELKCIQESIRGSGRKSLLEVVVAPAARHEDLELGLLEHQPTIVHFSGHGQGTKGLVFQGDNDDLILVDAAAIGELFMLVKKNIRVVVLNACYTEEQASVIVTSVDYVIGMRQEIGDKAARHFAASFYRTLIFGQSMAVAFGVGVNALRRAGMSDYADIPKLFIRKGISDDVALFATEP